jgi:hypothetical protein
LGTRIDLEVAPQIIMNPVSAMTPVGIYHHDLTSLAIKKVRTPSG